MEVVPNLELKYFNLNFTSSTTYISVFKIWFPYGEDPEIIHRMCINFADSSIFFLKIINMDSRWLKCDLK